MASFAGPIPSFSILHAEKWEVERSWSMGNKMKQEGSGLNITCNTQCLLPTSLYSCGTQGLGSRLFT